MKHELQLRRGEPLRGYRTWFVYARENGRVPKGTLLPLNWPLFPAWPRGQRFEATCGKREPHEPHNAPEESCECGIYARKEPPEHRHQWLTHGRVIDVIPFAAQRGFDDDSGRVWLAHGSVQLWGKVIEGRYGWRTQYGYPERLMLHRFVRKSKTSFSGLDDAGALTELSNLVVETYSCEAFPPAP